MADEVVKYRGRGFQLCKVREGNGVLDVLDCCDGCDMLSCDVVVMVSGISTRHIVFLAAKSLRRALSALCQSNQGYCR